MPTVYLHVGATKTGTTYLQNVLARNRVRLRQRGVLWPGERWRDQVHATNDLLGRDRGRGAPDVRGAWDRLAAEINAWDGPAAIMSMEFLSFADAAAARRAVESFAPNRVRVVVTGRDLLRVIPAIWQESVQNGHTLPYRAYLDRLVAVDYHGNHTGVSGGFWGQQDLARMLRVWQPQVAPQDLVLVTVPRPGADRSLLLSRFTAAVDLDPAGLRPAYKGNESLGATSAELMRRLNVRAERSDEDWATMQALKWRVAKHRLSRRKADEPTLVLPRDYVPWVSRQQQQLVRAIQQVDPVVLGDLDDLLHPADGSVAPTGSPGTVAETTHIPADDLLDAALDAIVGMAREFGRKKRPTA